MSSQVINSYRFGGGEQLLYEVAMSAHGSVQENTDYATAMAQVFDTGYSFTKITKVVVYLRKFGSPTNTISIGLWDTSAEPKNPTAESVTTLDTSTVTTSAPSGAYLPYEFEDFGEQSLSGDDIKIGIINNSPDSSNYVQFPLTTATLSDRQSKDDYLDDTVWRTQRPQSWIIQVWGG